jgi:hypothetical protein
MAQLPFRSLARLRSQCEVHAGLSVEGGSYSDGLAHGYRRALVEIDETLVEGRPIDT